MNAKYNKPLWRCLFESLPGKQVDINKLVKPTSIWLDMRQDRRDIDAIDPEMARLCVKAFDFKTMICKKDLAVKETEREHQVAMVKINAASDAMIQMQRKKVEEMGSTDVENSPLFQVNKNNIIVWKGNKTQVLEKAFQCALDELCMAENDLEKHIEHMIESAYAIWAKHMNMEPDVGIDPDLFGELEAIMQTESTPKALAALANADLGRNERLDDHSQVCDGMQDVNLNVGSAPHMVAKTMLLQRKATTTGVSEEVTVDVTSDQTESQTDYDKRMAINAKMRFYRSLNNRQLIGELFESWLTSGEDWMQSSIVVNSTRSLNHRRRGRYIMMEYRNLKTRFGNGVAKQMLNEKKQMEETKDPNDPLTYWMKHPDVASEDFEMVRVFDSMVFEDEVTEALNMGISATGDLDKSQTRQVMQVAAGGEIGKFQASGLGVQPGVTSSTPPPKVEKQKKAVPLSKQVTNKISSSSAKLTELMAWEAKVQDNKVLSETLLNGFKNELNARKTAIATAKTGLEGVYAQILGKSDPEIQGDSKLAELIQSNLANVESAFTSFNGTIKSIKLAIDPPTKKELKAKAKAKSVAAPEAAAAE
ncbi:unnamed protein product [Cladocopium goreaui]|uniref:Uncharacterized protein n=1 Tax=Cladocopium goreaui TaxID=2562237 RepID=A0A9P1GHU3_9DINO|nr:unnamed protein product [Cladocopium goreaui]